MTFISKMESDFQNKFSFCAAPGCTKETIRSHIFGEALLKKYFNSNKCGWYIIDDEGSKKLSLAGINNEIGYHVFCKECDNNLFRPIDDVHHNINNQNNVLLHFFRVAAYQYQFSRLHLAMAQQIIYATPSITKLRIRHTGVDSKDNIISLDHFIHGYIRYVFKHDLLMKIWAIIKNGNHDSLITISRVVKTKDIFFAQGILNPKTDLLKQKIIFEDHAAIIYYILPHNSDHIQVNISTHNSEYCDLLKQLKDVNDYKFKKYIGNFLEKRDTPRNSFVSPETKSFQKILR